MMNSAILENLNPSQKEAVCWNKAPLLVIAGAGSGKTRILTRRIAYLIAQGVPSFNILGVTFTNKASQEMKLRVQKLIQQEVWISTFHSTCLRILRMDGPAIELDRQFTIYDDQDQLSLIKEAVKELNLNDKQIHPKGVRERIQRAKDVLMTPYQYAEKAEDRYEDAVAKVYELYEKKLNQMKACDFGDLIMKTVALFDRRPEILKSWQERFQHILIDEYQDTNHAQYRFVRLLASARKQITVVGDPDQSIYAWRGADIQNILNFEKDYPECGIIKLEQNYRSTSVILDAANELIQHNRMRKPKALWTEREEGKKIRLFEAFDEKEEAEYVVRQVVEKVSSKIPLADQVVFYRVHAQSRILEDMLRRAKIPYKIVGGVRFYDRKEIKDLTAYLRVIAFPHDDVNLKRILNVPARGIGKKAVETLEQVCLQRQWSFDEAVKRAGQVEGLTPKTRKSLEIFYAMLEQFRRQKDQQVSELLEKIIERTGYVETLKAEKTAEAESRIENIEEFFSVIYDFEETFKDEKMNPLESFLESISLATDFDTWDGSTNVLTLMTLHTAKGLEFPVVYMVGLEEGIFPNSNAYTDQGEDLEEERRLCYVGITRAKDQLYLTYARERRLYGSRHYNLPSRFLNEIPSELYETSSALMLRDSGADPFLSEDLDMDPDFDDEVEGPIFSD